MLRRVVEHLELEAEIGGYEAAEQRADAMEGVYRSVAALLGASPSEVALTQSESDAWERAFWALPLAEGDVVLTSRAEYVSNALSLLLARERRGIRVEVVPDDEWGQLDVTALAARIDDPAVRLVAVSHVPSQGGLVNPAPEIGALCRSAGVPFLLDACQSVDNSPPWSRTWGVTCCRPPAASTCVPPGGRGSCTCVRGSWTGWPRPPSMPGPPSGPLRIATS